jgi:hypothetical protein
MANLAISSTDYKIGELLDGQSDYTAVLFSDPNEMRYKAEFAQPLHMDLKREADPVYGGRRAPNSTDSRPLFEKYQFFTPGMYP